MATYHVYDNFPGNSGDALDSDWTVVFGNAYQNGNNQAEVAHFGTAQTIALDTSSTIRLTNLCADTSLDVTKPTTAAGSYWLIGVAAGCLNPAGWGAFIAAPTHPLGWLFVYNTQFGLYQLLTLFLNGAVVNWTGGANYSWAVGETKNMKISIRNDATTDPYDPGYQLAENNGPQLMILRLFLDGEQLFQTGIGQVTPTVPGGVGLTSRGWPNGTVEGFAAFSFGPANPATDLPQFANFKKVDLRSGLELAPSCIADPTLTPLTLSAEVQTSTHNLNDTTLYPDAVFNDSTDWVINETQTENQYRITHPTLSQGRRTIEVTWSNRTQTEKDNILTTCFSSDASDTVLQFDPPGEEGQEQLWVALDNTVSIVKVAPDAFSISVTLLEVRKTA